MPTKVVLPEMGEGVTDATITQWLKQEGDTVEKYDAVVEVNTDKVDTEIPSPINGTVLKILYPADTVVSVNQTLCWIGEAGEEIPADEGISPQAAEPPVEAVPVQAEPAAPPPAPKPAPAPQPVRVPPAAASGHLKGAVTPLAARVAQDQGIDPAQVRGSGLGGMVTRNDILAYVQSGGANRRADLVAAEMPASLSSASPASTFISPVVSRLAAEHQIDLGKVQGTGKDGRITKLDMQHVIESGTAGAAKTVDVHPAYAHFQAGMVVKHTPVRRSIAAHMVESKHTSPHVSTFMEVDMSRVFAHRSAHKAAFLQQDAKLTFTAYFVSAMVTALQAYPLVNSSWSEDGIILHPEINIGMAVSLDADGLIVPVIKQAGQLDLLGIAKAVNDLAERARTKQLSPAEVRGGTFTITNHGTSGSLFATPIINQPQCGILGAGAIQKRAVVVGDAIAIRPMVYLSLTFDHRILDGAVADYFLGAVKQTLENWEN